ncbi:hypothetical protein PMAYCL1PPCAC_25098, partial [Pristionchus mayeri]
LPPAMDWSTRGIVNRVKEQGACSSSWAFSVTGALEGQHAIQKGARVDLSEQQLIDCATNGANAGCSGGSMIDAYEYIMQNNGLDTEPTYPYVGEVLFVHQQYCHPRKDTIGETMSGFRYIASGSEEDLMDAVAFVGPVSVAVDASHQELRNFVTGIYYEPACNSNPNLAMLVVGYGFDSKEGDYWILKNAWGTSWGEKGYMKLARNRNNHCGIASMATTPTL